MMKKSTKTLKINIQRMKGYSCTSITGYKGDLGTKYVRIPLKYPEFGSPSVDSHELFTQLLANTGEIINFENYLSFIDLVSFDVLNDLSTINLTPVMLNSQLSLDLQKVEIKLPNKLLNSLCFSVSIQETTEDLNLVIDLLDSKLLFITLIVNLKDFIVDQGNKFNLSDFQSWGHISVPYSFELRADPYFMKSIDSNNCIISLADGGLLHFQRPAPLEDFDIYQFTENHESVGFFNSFFKDSGFKTNTKNSLVDLLAVGNQIAALTVDKTLKFFDLTSHELVSASKVGDNTLLANIPKRYMNKVDSESPILLFHTSNSFLSKESVLFKVWDISKGSLTKEFHVSTPSHTGSTWFIQDFTTKLTNTLELEVLWKYNFSSELAKYSIDSNLFNVLEFQFSESNDPSDDFLQSFDEDYYKSQVTDSGAYDDLILKTSVNILRERLQLPKSDSLLIMETINKFREQDDSKPWFMLNSLCEEYKKLSKEVLSLGSKNDQLISLQANGLGVYRPLSIFEEFISKNDELGQILQTIDIKLSKKTIFKVFQYVSSLQSLNNDTLLYISEEILNLKFDTEIQEVSQVLDNYPKVLDVMDKLVEGESYVKSGFETSMSIFQKVNCISSFKDIMRTHKNLLIKLIILFSKFENNQTLLDLSNKILQKFSDLKLLDAIFTDNYQQSIIYRDLLVKGDVVNKYYYLNAMVKTQNYLVSITSKLTERNQHDIVLNDLLERINTEENKYLVALIYLTNNDLRFIDYLTYENHSAFDSAHKLTNELDNFLNDPIKSESEYYHKLSCFIAGKGPNFTSKAIQLEKAAIQSLSASESSEVQSTYHENIFNMCLQHPDGDSLPLAVSSLSNTESSPNFRDNLSKFIHWVINQKRFHELVGNQNGMSNLVKNNYKLIDTILNELAESQPTLKSVKYYEIIYSFRIKNNKRGAIESLYAFISRFESDKHIEFNNRKVVYLKILEFHLIILNCLKSFKNDKDRWLLKYGNKNQLVTLKDLKYEYASYLQKLNSV